MPTNFWKSKDNFKSNLTRIDIEKKKTLMVGTTKSWNWVKEDGTGILPNPWSEELLPITKGGEKKKKKKNKRAKTNM